jgi:NADPH2:quinone reductase
MASREPMTFNPLSMYPKNATLIGMSLSATFQNEYARPYKVIADCIDRVAAGELRVVVDKNFPLAEAAKAHAYVEQRAAFGRVVMLPRG